MQTIDSTPKILSTDKNLTLPLCMAFDYYDNLYIANGYKPNAILKYASGDFLICQTLISYSTGYLPMSLVFDIENNMYVGIANKGVIKYPFGITNNTQFYFTKSVISPVSMAITSQNCLIISDYAASEIFYVLPNTTYDYETILITQNKPYGINIYNDMLVYIQTNGQISKYNTIWTFNNVLANETDVILARDQKGEGGTLQHEKIKEEEEVAQT
jgi:hypothetical protein